MSDASLAKLTTSINHLQSQLDEAYGLVRESMQQTNDYKEMLRKAVETAEQAIEERDRLLKIFVHGAI
jgi:methyl-accepting chemotaxis protein